MALGARERLSAQAVALAAAVAALLVTAPARAADGRVVEQGVAEGQAVIVVPAGRRVGAALEELRAQGLRVLYSSALVAPSLQTRERVVGRNPDEAARAMLRQVGLELRAVGTGVFAVVEAPRGLRWLVAGRIVDDASGTPISDARIELIEDGYVAWSDDSGSFALQLRGRAARTLRVSGDGYAPMLKALAFPAAAHSDLPIRLARLERALEEITVVASRFTYQDPIAGNRFRLDQAAIAAQPKVGEDALQAMATLPGIAFSGSSARPNVRGGEVGELLVVLDGMPIREAFHLPAYNAAFSSIDEGLVERLDAYTGTLPVRFGNRLGAVVDLRSVEPGETERHAIGLSTWNASLRTGGRADGAGDTDWLFATRRGTAEHWIDKYALDVGRPEYQDAFARLTTITAGGLQLGARALWSDSSLVVTEADTSEIATLDSTASYVWFTVARPATQDGGLSLSGTLGVSQIDSARRGTVAEGFTPEGRVDDTRESRLWDLILRADWATSSAQHVELGLTATRGRGRYRYRSEAEFEAVASELFGLPEDRQREANLAVSQTNVGAFMNLRRQLGEGVFLDFGGRVDQERGTGSRVRSIWSPRVALRWDASPFTIWRASLGRSQQRDEVHELRVEDGVDTPQPSQRSDQLVLGFERRMQAGLMLRVEGYTRRLGRPRTRYENLYDPLRFLPELSPDRVAVSPRRAALRGVEVSTQWERGPWSLWGAYAWSESEDEFADGARVPRDWDQRHALALAASWRRGPWSLSALTQIHSGRPTTPVLDTRLVAPRLGPRNSARLGACATLDLRVSREFPLAVGRLVAYGQITNALNRRNPCCTELDLPSDASDPTRLETAQLSTYPAVPAIGVQWRF